jgi:hypothetical protein
VIAVVALVFWALLFGTIGFFAGLLFSQRELRSDLVTKVRDILDTDTKFALDTKKAVRDMRTLLALDGHRLPKHVRDAANVWLAEREAAE